MIIMMTSRISDDYKVNILLLLLLLLMFYMHILNLFYSEKLSESLMGIDPVTF